MKAKKTVETIVDEMTIVFDDKKIIVGMKGLVGERPTVYERIYDSTRKVVENNEYPTKRPFKLYHNLTKKYISMLKKG